METDKKENIGIEEYELPEELLKTINTKFTEQRDRDIVIFCLKISYQAIDAKYGLKSNQQSLEK